MLRTGVQILDLGFCKLASLCEVYHFVENTHKNTSSSHVVQYNFFVWTIRAFDCNLSVTTYVNYNSNSITITNLAVVGRILDYLYSQWSNKLVPVPVRNCNCICMMYKICSVMFQLHWKIMNYVNYQFIVVHVIAFIFLFLFIYNGNGGWKVFRTTGSSD